MVYSYLQHFTFWIHFLSFKKSVVGSMINNESRKRYCSQCCFDFIYCTEKGRSCQAHCIIGNCIPCCLLWWVMHILANIPGIEKICITCNIHTAYYKNFEQHCDMLFWTQPMTVLGNGGAQQAFVRQVSANPQLLLIGRRAQGGLDNCVQLPAKLN